MVRVRARHLSLCLALLAGLCPSASAGDPGAAPPPAAQAAPQAPVADSLASVAPWLSSPDWTVRSIAAFGLRRRAEPGTVVLLARLLARESDARVVGCALGALAGRPRVDLVSEGGTALAEALVRLLDQPHPLLAERALQLLSRLPTIDLGERADLLKGWWARGRLALEHEQAGLLARRAAPPPGGTPPAPGETETVAPQEPDLLTWVAGLQRDGLDLVIVMDSTGSMGGVIAAAKAQCQALVRRLRALVPQFRAGLVTYDDAARLRVVLTTDAEELQKGFDRLAAVGGGDVEEGVDKGIYLALKQEQVGWSRKAQRVVVVVGDAPPHLSDVAALLKRLARSAEDDLFDHPVTVHCVSTDGGGVDHFAAIARAGRGVHVSLGRTERLAEELVLLSFARSQRALAEAWLAELDRLEAGSPAR